MSRTKRNIVIIQNSVKTTYLFRRTLMEMYVNNGWSVHLVCVNDSDEHLNLINRLGVDVHCVKGSYNPLGKAFSFNYLLLKLLFSYRISKVQCHFLSTFLLCLPFLLLQQKKTTLIVEGIGSLLIGKKYLQRMTKSLLTTMRIRRVFMNKSERNLLGRETDVVLNGIGIDLCDYNKKVNKPCKIDTIKMSYAGRLIADKGIFDCFKLLHFLTRKGLKCKLDIFGDIYPSNPTSLKNKDIERLKVYFSDQVSFNGFKDNLSDHIAESDLFLLLSKQEGFPVVVMEASAVGVPSLCYDVIGSRDAIGSNGYIIKKDDFSSAYSFIQKIICMSLEQKREFSGQCRLYAEENFDRNEKNKLLFNLVTDDHNTK